MNNLLLLISLLTAGFFILYFILKHNILKIINPDSLVKEIKKEVDQVIVELNRTTEGNIGLLEDKINTLSELLARADKRILLLQRESEKFTLGKNYNNILKQAGNKTGETEIPVKPEIEIEIKEPVKETTIQEKVLMLYAEGVSKSVIAAKLNLAMGEVELIISLNEAENVELKSKP